MPTITPNEFRDKWRHNQGKERSVSQEHFIDLCRLIGHQTPSEYDPSTRLFSFEYGASKQTGGEGWADVCKIGYFAWEYKGKHANLDKAYAQLLQYREALNNPPLLVVSDIERIIIRTNITNSATATYELSLDDLCDPTKLEILRRVFYSPETLKSTQTSENVTAKAADKFARLADVIRTTGARSLEIAHFLIRVLFCLFAEDTGLLPAQLFSRLVHNSRNRPAVFNVQLRQLFQAMASGGPFGVEMIQHFNGKLFDNDTTIPLDSAGLDILAEVCDLDWSAIEPSILGTLFERSLDPDKRSQLGAHYTSADDIMRVIEPVLMAPLRRDFEQVQAQAVELAAQVATARGARANKLRDSLAAMLVGMQGRISGTRVLDAACGSGNFLYLALKSLLGLEKQVSLLAGQVGLSSLLPSVNPAQLYGIEVNTYAHQLAQVTVWIGYIQWLRDNGYGYQNDPVLRPLDNIQQRDAIMTYDAEGKPLEPDWPEADVIIGNPPFLGSKMQRSQLGDTYLDDLYRLYNGRVPKEADLVCYWFEKARALLQATQVKRVGLLATQAIRGGANRKVLESIQRTGRIFWAWADRDWVLDGATVHVSMVGFDNGAETTNTLDGQAVSRINADLTSVVDATQALPLTENKGISFMGDIKVGPFDLTPEQAQVMLQAGGNPNGRPNSDVIRRWVNGMDVTGHSRGMWIIDFGVDMPETQAAQYELPFEYVRKYVKPTRLGNRMTHRALKWWIHGDAAPRIRIALQSLSRYLATTSVSKYRLFSWLRGDILPDHALIVFARDDDYFLGMLQSSIHDAWSTRQGTQLREAESGRRYTPTTCFETFPLPWPPGQEPNDDPLYQAIAAAAHELVQQRDAWLNPPGLTEAELKKRTLTNLYNLRPTWLALAHERLDASVLAAYGWPVGLSEDELLARLLELNLRRAAK